MTPDVLTNWSKTQQNDFKSQLEAGFRTFDLRVADMNSVENGTFRWWHGVTGDEIEEGLNQILEFAILHLEEVIILGSNTSQHLETLTTRHFQYQIIEEINYQT